MAKGPLRERYPRETVERRKRWRPRFWLPVKRRRALSRDGFQGLWPVGAWLRAGPCFHWGRTGVCWHMWRAYLRRSLQCLLASAWMGCAGAASSLAQVSVEATVATAEAHPLGPHHIVLAGRIDVHALYSVVRLMEDRRIADARRPVLKLDSHGGSVAAAMAIGHIIRDRGFTTVVDRGKECLSACVLILAAGSQRIVASRRVGVHRPRHGVAVAAPSTVAQARVDGQLIEDLQRYLQTMGMGERLFAVMMAVPADRMKMLSRGEMHAVGLLPPGQKDAPAASASRRTLVAVRRRPAGTRTGAVRGSTRPKTARQADKVNVGRSRRGTRQFAARRGSFKS